MIACSNLENSKLLQNKGVFHFFIENFDNYNSASKETVVFTFKNLIHKMNLDLIIYLINECKIIELFLNILRKEEFSKTLIFDTIFCMFDIFISGLIIENTVLEKITYIRFHQLGGEEILNEFLIKVKNHELFTNANSLKTIFLQIKEKFNNEYYKQIDC